MMERKSNTSAHVKEPSCPVQFLSYSNVSIWRVSIVLFLPGSLIMLLFFSNFGFGEIFSSVFFNFKCCLIRSFSLLSLSILSAC